MITHKQDDIKYLKTKGNFFLLSVSNILKAFKKEGVIHHSEVYIKKMLLYRGIQVRGQSITQTLFAMILICLNVG